MKKIITFITFFLISLTIYSQLDTNIYNKAKEFYSEQNYNKSVDLFRKCVPYANTKEKTTIYHYLGICNMQLGDYDLAIEDLQKCVDLNKKINNTEGVGNAYNNLALVYDLNKRFKESLKYHYKSLVIARKLKDTLSMAGSFNNISSINIQLEQYDKALVHAKKALKINLDKEEIYPSFLNYTNIGNAYRGLGMIDKALLNHNIALEIAKKLGYDQTLAQTYNNIGEDYLILKDYEKSIYYLNFSKHINTKNNYLYYNHIVYSNLSEAYEKLNVFDSALVYNKLYIEIKDSIFSKESRDKIEQLNIKFKTKENENEILKLKHEDEIKEKEIQKQKITNNYLLIIILISSLFLFLIFFLYKRVKKALNRNEIITKELKIKNDDINDSINYAKNIQKGIISTKEKFKENVSNSFLMFRPKDVLSGDFYWSKKKNNKKYFSAGDCTGHGVPGAMLSVIGSTGLTRAINENKLEKPSEILTRLNVIVSEAFDEDQSINNGMDISLCVIDEETNILQCASANNPVYIVRSLNGTPLDFKSRITEDKILYKVPADKKYVGYGENFKYTHNEIQLEEGDLVYIFSDGYADQFGGEKGKKYMSTSFQRLLSRISNIDIDQQEKELKEEFVSWIGKEEQIDDVIVIGVKI